MESFDKLNVGIVHYLFYLRKKYVHPFGQNKIFEYRSLEFELSTSVTLVHAQLRDKTELTASMKYVLTSFIASYGRTCYSWDRK